MRKILLLIAIGTILSLTALACAPAAPVVNPTRSPSPTPQSAATLWATPTPWVTRMPTFTPRPTATPGPTDTPEPPTPTPATPAYYPYTPRPPATPTPTPTPEPSATPRPGYTRTPAPARAETANCSLFADQANLFREHDVVQWSQCPVIENGILRAAGTVSGGRTLLNSPSVATFVIKYRNSNRDALVILRPAPPGASYPKTPGTAEAILWEVSSKSFSIRVPVGNLEKPVDLLVWGSDIPGAYTKAPPLAIHSIRYIE